MKKKMKRFFASVLAFAMMFSTLTFTSAAAEDEYQMFLAIGADAKADDDWGYLYYGNGASSNAGDVTATDATAKVGDTVTIGVSFPTEVIYTWFMAPVLVAENVGNVDYTIDSVKIDGEDVTDKIDFSAGKAFWYEGTGDYSETQAVRLAGGYNEWGDKYMAESPKGFKEITYTITLNAVEEGAAAAAEETVTVAPVDLNGTYNAYIGIQTPNWSFRNAYDDATYGLGTDFFNQITGWDADNNAITIPGNIHDTVISGNGTYTVSIDGLSFPDGEFSTQEFLNLIFISTDIPNSGEITFSDVKLTIDGKNVDLPNGAILDPDSKEVTKLLLQNIWNNDCKEIGYYAVPMTDISITFTVSGFAYDNEASAETTETVAESTPAETTPAAEETSSNTGLIVGIVVAAVVVIGGVVAGVVVSKKKKAN